MPHVQHLALHLCVPRSLDVALKFRSWFQASSLRIVPMIVDEQESFAPTDPRQVSTKQGEGTGHQEVWNAGNPELWLEATWTGRPLSSLPIYFYAHPLHPRDLCKSKNSEAPTTWTMGLSQTRKTDLGGRCQNVLCGRPGLRSLDVPWLVRSMRTLNVWLAGFGAQHFTYPPPPRG